MSGYENRVPAGWYPDQNMAGTERYWDGQRWTEHVQPVTPKPAPSYEPPSHRDPQPAQALQPPTPGLEPAVAKRQDKQRSVIGVVLAICALAGAAMIVYGVATLFLSSGEDGAGSAGQAADRIADGGTDTNADGEIDDGSVVIGEDEPGELGTRENPLPYESESQLRFETFGDADGSVWLTTVGEPRDITAEVLAENPFNAAPPEGVLYIGFEASMTLFRADKEPLAPGFNFSWELLGGQTAAVYDVGTIETESFGCGVVPAEFDNFSEVFVGGTVSGTVCIPFPAEDFGDPNSQVAIHFVDDTRAIFGS